MKEADEALEKELHVKCPSELDIENVEDSAPYIEMVDITDKNKLYQDDLRAVFTLFDINYTVSHSCVRHTRVFNRNLSRWQNFRSWWRMN